MNDRHNMSVPSCDLVTGAHITHIYINQTPDKLNEKSLDTKILVSVPVEYNTSNSTFAFNESPSLYSSNDDGKNAVEKILNNSTPYEYSKVIQSSQFIVDNKGTYSCRICINDNETLNSVNKTINTDTDGIHTECNKDTNRSISPLEDNEYYCEYTFADIDEISDGILNNHQPSILRIQSSRRSSFTDYSSNESLVSDFETSNGIVTFLDKSNNEVRIITVNLLDINEIINKNLIFEHIIKLIILNFRSIFPVLCTL